MTFIWTDPAGMSRSEADHLAALACTLQLTRLTLENATGETGPSHKAEDIKEAFAKWLEKESAASPEARRRSLFLATSLASPGTDRREVLKAADWTLKQVSSTTS